MLCGCADSEGRMIRSELVGLLEKALVKPKKRVKTKPSRAQKERRLEGKSKRSEIKRNRTHIDKD